MRPNTSSGFEDAFQSETGNAWGAGLEDAGDKKLVVQRPIPKTLAEAVGIKPTVKAVPGTPYTMVTTLFKLKNLAQQVETDWQDLSRFPDSNQGLAMNKLANLKDKIEELIEALESK
jgi:hypothetical protein